MSWKNVQYENGKLRTSSGGSGGASALSDLTDVDLTNLADGDTLVYDEQNQKWVNGAGGGGGGSSITALNTDQITSLNTPSNLSDAITNYDLILVQAYYTGGSGYPFVGSVIFSPLLLSSHNNSIWIDGGNNDRALHIQFPTTTTVQIIQSNGGNGIQGIYGIKLSSSGGGGSSTLADLTDVDLTNVTDGQILKWDATNSKWVNANESGGGGSTSITETSLWTASNQSTGDFTLSSSIDNFDFIAIWYGDWNERTSWKNYILYSVESLNANHNAGLKISIIGYGTRYNIIDISGTTLSIITNSSQAILEVKGLKLSSSGGGGGGSSHTYSTTEQVVGTWTDGRDVYEQTFEFTPTSSGYYTDVTSLNIDFVVSLIGGVNQTNGNKVPVPYASASNDFALCYVNGGTKLMAVFAGNYNIAPWKIILRWLKPSS